jgi:3-oxoacyl-[acyl-carrier protein] reductase
MFKNYIKRGIKYLLYGVPTQYVTPQIVYSTPSHRLEGKRIVITGGGRGLGFAMAKKFVDEGASVLIAGRNEDTLRVSAQELRCHYLTIDVQDVASFDSFILKADDLLGGINCLVNNAGISLHESQFTAVTEESFDAQINTNLRGPFFMAQKFVQLIEKNNREGNILFMSSETSHTADIRPYGLTKAAINSLVKGLASKYASKGIRVNAVAPGITTSDMTGFKADANLFLKSNATGRVYLPEEVAECACFLLSDVSGCVSGEVLTCNNGKTINTRWK